MNPGFHIFFVSTFYQISHRGNQKEGWLSSLDGGKYVVLIHSSNTFYYNLLMSCNFHSFSRNMQTFAFGISHQV